MGFSEGANAYEEFETNTCWSQRLRLSREQSNMPRKRFVRSTLWPGIIDDDGATHSFSLANIEKVQSKNFQAAVLRISVPSDSFLGAVLQVITDAPSVPFLVSPLVNAGARVTILCLLCWALLGDHLNCHTYPIQRNLCCKRLLGLREYKTAVFESRLCTKRASVIVRGEKESKRCVVHIGRPSGKVY